MRTSIRNQVCSQFIAVAFALLLPFASGFPSTMGEDTQPVAEWIRGSGKDLQIRLRGEVKTDNSEVIDEATVNFRITYNDQLFETLSPRVEEGEFEVWLPVNRYPWYSIKVTARCGDGARCDYVLLRSKLRGLAASGLTLEVKRPEREVEIQVEHEGKAISGAMVRAKVMTGAEVLAKSNASGVAKLALMRNENLASLTAWTEEMVGGYQFARKPVRDPAASEHTIKMFRCRPYEIELRDVDGNPIADVPVRFDVATAPPEYNFLGTPDNIELITDQDGFATYPLFPKIDKAHRSVRLIDTRWIVESSQVLDDKATIVARPAATRQAVTGVVVSNSHSVAGVNVRLGTFQAEEESQIDFIQAYTDAKGRFSVEVLPDATYCAFVEDAEFVSKPIDLIPYDSTTKTCSPIHLKLARGIPARIRLTSGPNNQPLKNQFVNINSDHSFDWREDGKTKSGSLGRSAHSFTDENGVIEFFAPAGPLEAGVYTPDWRSTGTIDVLDGQTNEIHLHRKIAQAITVTGRIEGWDSESELAGARIVLGSIDGESDDRIEVEADADGTFQVETKASKLGVIAFSADERFAGSTIINNVKKPAKLTFYPTKSYAGQIIDQDGKPVPNHPVTASIQISDETRYDLPFSTTFYAPRIEAKTDEQGRYRFEHLPCKTPIRLWTARLDLDPNRTHSIDRVFFLPDDERTERITRIGERPEPRSQISLEQRMRSVQRDCVLGDYHLMVILSDNELRSSDQFVDTHLVGYARNKKVMSYMQLSLDPKQLSEQDREFAESQKWQPISGSEVFVCVYDAEGVEKGRAVFDSLDGNSSSLASEFVNRYAPPKKDAFKKWEQAFKKARETDKRVWARVSQRYCGPCFILSRWLDDHREILEQDFVFLKIDDVRDENGAEVAERLTHGRSVGVPFHAIFDSDEEMLTDSSWPTWQHRCDRWA